MDPHAFGDDVDVLRYSAERSEIARFVPSGAGRVLDVGCGTGGFGVTIRSVDPGAELWGVEPVAEAADIASARYDRVMTGFYPVDTEDLPARAFGAVFMLDVLEHMVEPAEALRAARSLLAPGGVLVASIPNVRHFDVWWPLVRHGRWTYTETGLMDRTHLRWFTRSSIEELFAGTGWTVTSLEGINRTDPAGWKARLLARLGRRTEDMFVLQFAVTAVPAP